MFEDIEKILAYAVWAPSGDNSQPWRFSLKENILKTYNLPDKDLPFYNFEQRGSHVAHGALIENIDIASSGFGYGTTINLFPNTGEQNLVASITFEKSDRGKDPLFDFIKLRRTNRKFYKNDKLSSEAMQEIKASVQNIPGVELRLTEDPEQKKIIGKASADNEKIVLYTEHLHQPFFNHVVWTEKQEHVQKHGLYFKTLELPGPKGIIFKMASDWKKMKILQKIGLPKLIVADNAKLYSTGGAIAVIVTKNNSPADFIATGRAMQRAWLTVAKLKLNAHPVTGILFLMQRVFVNQTEGLTAEQVAIVKNSYKDIEKSFGVSQGFITFLFRIGEAPEPSATCSRMDPEIAIEA